MICPKRLADGGRIFTDALHLLTKHKPGNEYHLLPEVPIPGGSVDFVLASVHRQQVVDFVGIELQTLDTTGTVWPERQRFLMDVGAIPDGPVESKSYGMNWKHTSKTILVQMHHKAQTFSHVNRHLVLVVQDRLLDYMRRELSWFVCTVSKHEPRNWELCKAAGMFGYTRGLSRARVGDRLLFWRGGRGYIGYGHVTEPPRVPTSRDEAPWPGGLYRFSSVIPFALDFEYERGVYLRFAGNVQELTRFNTAKLQHGMSAIPDDAAEKVVALLHAAAGDDEAD